MSLNFADLLSTPGAATLFDSSAQASSLAYHDSSHVDLSDVDFDYLTQCNHPATLHSIIQQLEHEPFPELLQAARHRLSQLDDSTRLAVERKRREGEERQAVKSELEQWSVQQKQAEEANTGIHVHKQRKQPPIRSSKPTNAETAEAVVGGREGEEGTMSGEEKTRRIASEKQKGNECYKAGEYSTAAEHYSTAIALLPPPYNTASTTVHPTSFSSSASSAASTANTYDSSLHTNLAMSHLRLSQYQQAVNTASAALTHSYGAAVKGWWRRAQAYRGLERYGEAMRDYTEGIKRADDAKVGGEMEREMRRLQADMLAAAGEEAKKVGRREEEEKWQMEEERKEKTRADTMGTTSDKLKRMTIVEDDSDDSDGEEAVEDEKKSTSSQAVFKAPRGGMTIEVLK